MKFLPEQFYDLIWLLTFRNISAVVYDSQKSDEKYELGSDPDAS